MTFVLRASQASSSSHYQASNSRTLATWKFCTVCGKRSCAETPRGVLQRGMSFAVGQNGLVQRGVVRPVLWKELKEMIDDGSTEALSKLGRLHEDVLVYRAYRSRVCHLITSMSPELSTGALKKHDVTKLTNSHRLLYCACFQAVPFFTIMPSESRTYCRCSRFGIQCSHACTTPYGVGHTAQAATANVHVRHRMTHPWSQSGGRMCVLSSCRRHERLRECRVALFGVYPVYSCHAKLVPQTLL
jgi:hypothetical protein